MLIREEAESALLTDPQRADSGRVYQRRLNQVLLLTPYQSRGSRMEFGTFDVVPKRKHINVFKVGKLWLFKYFFDNREFFETLLDHYNKDLSFPGYRSGPS